MPKDIRLVRLNWRILLAFLFSSFVWAQELQIGGYIKNSTGDPIAHVAVLIPELSLGTYCDDDGSFTLLVPNLEYPVVVSVLGYKTETIDLKSMEDLENLRIVLEEDLLNLDEIVVTAKKTSTKEGTSVYKVESQAIKQVQIVNLSDVLSLLPGNAITPPDLSRQQQTNLRTAVPSNINSFGTAIILDGAVLNNDANFQAINPSASFSGGNASAGRGIDLRTVSMANVESVEVITGVASPKYGNLSTGGILVKSKVGESPWIANANVTATNYQGALVKGFELSKLGILNTDFSYAYNSGSPTERKTFYQTFNLGLRWKLNEFKPLQWNHFTSFRITYSDDGNRDDPDEVFKDDADVKSTNYQFGLSGDLRLSPIGTISYLINGSINEQRSFFDRTNERGPFPIIEALESGTYFTTFTPSIFNQVTRIEGRAINFNARVEANQFFEKGDFNFNLETGIQYDFNDNTGKGRVNSGNVALPDSGGGIGNSLGNRSASFRDIPASKTFSAYHQTRIRRSGSKSSQKLNLGLRYDNMLERFNLLSPRLSFSSKHGSLNARAAWGLSYKAPAMIQLYPGRTYIDYTNFNFFAENPNERLAIVTTFVQEPTNTQLRPNYTDIKEIGFDWSLPFLNLQLTYFRKELRRGIQQTDELVLLPRQAYEVIDTPPDQPPVVAPIEGDVVNIPRTLNVLKNNFFVDTDGVEIVLSGLKINPTNTEINFRYSFLESLRTNLGFDIRAPNFVIGDNTARFGVYENSILQSIRSFGTLTLIQHIPSLRFVLTLATELNFNEYSINQNASQFPFAYYDIDGNFIPIPEDQRDSEEFRDLRRPPNVSDPITDTPFYANFNLQVRKETKQGHSFSFYAYNAPWYNPEFIENGTRRQLNQRLQVGFSLSLMIK